MRNFNRTGLFFSLVCGVSLMSSGIVASPTGIHFGSHSITNGETVTENDFPETPSKRAIAVGTGIEGVSADLGRYRLTVNGGSMTTERWENGGIAFLPTDLNAHLGDGDPWYWTLSSRPEFAFQQWFDEGELIFKPITFQVYDEWTESVVLRDRLVIYDARWNPSLSPAQALGEAVEASLARLTPTGLDKLEVVHHAMLPFPSLEDFNVGLTARAEARPADNFETDGDTCFPIATGSFWTRTSAYAASMTLAAALYATYESLSNASSSAGTSVGTAIGGPVGTLVGFGVGELAEFSVARAICVHSEPRPGDFEVCVDSFEVEMMGMELWEVLGVDLGFGDGSGKNLLTLAELGQLETALDVNLRNLRIQYAKGSACSQRASVEVSDSWIGSGNAIDDWASCGGGDWIAPSLVEEEAQVHTLGIDAGDDQGLSVLHVGHNNFVVEGEPWMTPLSGTCADPIIRDQIIETLTNTEEEGGFPDVVGEVVTQTWHDGMPTSDQSWALDMLMAPFEMGHEPIEGVDLSATFTSAEVSSTTGLQVSWRSEIHPDNPVAERREPTLWLNIPPGEPCDLSGTTWQGEPYDVAMSFSTGYINQFLRAQAFSDVFYDQRLRPSWSELGIADDPDATLDAPPVLDGERLSGIHSALAQIGEQEVEFIIRPTVAPITHMDLDHEPGLGRLMFEASQLIVELRNTGTTFGEPDGRWLRAVVDIYDKDLSLDMSYTESQARLEPTLRSKARHFTILDLGLESCERGFIGTNLYGSTCEGSVEEALGDLLIDRIEAMLLDMIRQIPTPQLFDAQGESSVSRSATQVGWCRNEQHIALYATLN